MLNLPGYKISEQISQGTETTTYRGVRLADDRPVVLKIVNTSDTTPHIADRLRHEFNLIKNLKSEAVIAPFALEETTARLFMVLEDFGGESLKQVIPANGLNLADFLHIARQLADSLNAIHRHELIHKDIKPSNILINPATQQIKIVDFSLAASFAEAVADTDTTTLEGTFAYMSPEQTRRTNRPIDYRTDFYSLGVTFFELLTGRLPFQATDPLELIHAHLAKPPPAPTDLRPGIPPALTTIVLKLMAKTPEERYQSATELKHELKLYSAPESPSQDISPAPLIEPEPTLPPQTQFNLYDHKVASLKPDDTHSATRSTSSSTTAALDIMAVLKAAQAISGEIALATLLKKLMSVVLENAGAQQGCLILDNQGDWLIEAVGSVDQEEVAVLQGLPFKESGQVSLMAIQAVVETGGCLVVVDALNDSGFATDTYVIDNQVRSILCCPILLQGKLSGILHLTNNLATGAFTSNHTEIIQILSSQVAISLENARLYEGLKQEMAERQRVTETLHTISEGTAAATGYDFCRSLVRHVANAFEVKEAFISEIIDDDKTQVKTLAYLEDGQILDDFEYGLAGTPCEDVVDGEVCYYPEKLSKLFAMEDGLESYLGIPLFDASGEVIGHLAVLHDQPKEYGQDDISTLKIFAARAGAEIERRRAEDALKQAHDLLELRVEERTAELQTTNTQLHREIAERSQAEAALAKSERLLRTVIDTAPAFVAYVDQEGVYQLVNTTYEDTFKMPRNQIIGHHFSQIFSGETQEQLRQVHRRVMAGERVAKTQLVKSADGQQSIWFHSVYSPFLSQAGQVDGFVAVSVDITETVEAEQKLREAKRSAESANRAKSEFLANMSHELRTPLNGILGYAQILRRDSTLTETQRDKARIIQQSGEHLLTLINDVLDLSKIEANKMELYPIDFNFTHFLDSVANIFQPPAEQKGLVFMYEKLSALPVAVQADEKRLRQIMLNLLSNAVKFTNKGGVILKVGYHQSKIRFQVEDTGQGIELERIDEIFSPFQQLTPDKRAVEGTGLGLTISRQLVRMMGSELQVKSQLDQGSTFWFELDLPEVPEWVEPIQEEPRNVIGFKGAKRQVLVVDDRWQNRSVLVNLLAPLGFQITEADSGQAALTKAQEIRPDLILMDLVMPGLDGIAATRQLRQHPDTKDVVIIALSASAFDQTRQDCLDAGCDDFIPKPVRIDDLLARIQHHLGLTWLYDEQPIDEAAEQSHLKSSSQPEETVIGPPAAEAKRLFHVAMQGDVKAIERLANELAALDGKFIPFADRVRQLAKTYQIDQISDLIKPYLEE